MRLVYALLAFILIGETALAQSRPDLQKLSARRELSQSWRGYAERARPFSQEPSIRNPPTALDSAIEFDHAQLKPATAWASLEDMAQNFRRFRDLRFIRDTNHGDFLRRSTWLFPDDGCYARAALAIRNLMRAGVKAPNKLFVFGDLAVQTPNSPGGAVGWWYHVAPVVEVNGQKYVLDPAVNASGPLALADWLARLNDQPGSLQVAVCGSGTYSPYDPCSAVSDGEEALAEVDQRGFLNDEWNRLIELNRQPEVELGDRPPWAN